MTPKQDYWGNSPSPILNVMISFPPHVCFTCCPASLNPIYQEIAQKESWRGDVCPLWEEGKRVRGSYEGCGSLCFSFRDLTFSRIPHPKKAASAGPMINWALYRLLDSARNSLFLTTSLSVGQEQVSKEHKCDLKRLHQADVRSSHSQGFQYKLIQTALSLLIIRWQIKGMM